jgi:hypothetical protein
MPPNHQAVGRAEHRGVGADAESGRQRDGERDGAREVW